MKKLLTLHHSGQMHWVGDGFPVRTVFSYNDLGRELSPFLLLDYAAPYTFAPGEKRRGVAAHPHKGFETVTITYQGELEHRDSTGAGAKIGPGDVQWMTAGRGIVHEEFHSQEFTHSGGTFQMAQLWVNLPARDKSAPSDYQTLRKFDIPVVDLSDNAGTARIIAGRIGSTSGPAKTFTPINLWDVDIRPDKRVDLPLPEGHTAAFLVLSGEILIEDGQATCEGDLAVFDPDGGNMSLIATRDSKILLMSGEPLDEPIAGYGPFVMNTRAEIQQAIKEFESGNFGVLR